ncbi:hypothetical protein QHH11_18500 [Aphanizomenon sp. PH219]|uniref:Uncharacterized protein n=1 Tax=Dolichospermum heterosporum TAC447 TaxID=747523 RepID=A0ABY5LRB0_9CYAN|nr:hypothetical protein [Dolichospermum heterosporum]MDK2408227.1 hypothetical protein [Aphanizomenon sp. 202]MDK2461098.1 hypothetical protein [Aphanizomenon sp. PH219]UUO14486.1 hypothetical protein NG743_21005 [Dolichospermum heterosporum TAC447]
MNKITINSDLTNVDYTDLLAKILLVLQKPNQQIFKLSDDNNRLRINIDQVATEVANLQVENPLGASGNSVRSATVNISPGSEQNFRTQIHAIKDCVKKLLTSSLGNSESIEEFVSKLITDLQTFKGTTSKLDFTYTFPPYDNLQKQRLTFNKKNPENRELLKVHKLTISVQKTHDFEAELRKGLEHHIRVKFAGANAEEKQDLEYILEDLEKDKNSDIFRLRDVVNKETLGKLKKQAQINYLEFLLENINTKTSNLNAAGAIYLEDLIRRLRLIETYINDSNKADGDYLVNYAGVSVNYKDAFSRGEAFDKLPIIPIVEGFLGETKDENRGEIQFVFGLKLKFDGKVHTNSSKSVFDDRLNILNPDSQEHKDALADPLKRESFPKKVLEIAFLYYFLFASPHNPKSNNYVLNDELKYDPLEAFEKKVIQKLQGSDETAKEQLLRNIYKYLQEFNIQFKINRLKGVLQNLLKRKTSFPTREYPVHISVKNGILEEDTQNIFNNNTLFKPVVRKNYKEVLKYISLGKPNTETNSLCTLPAKVTINDIHFFATEDQETFNMEYDLNAIRALPVIFAPLDDPRCLSIYSQHFKTRQLLLFPYRLEDKKLEPPQAFVYKFTYGLLAYICLELLLEKQKRLFIPILRLHLNTKDDDAPIEKFIVSLSAVLSHLFNETHRANEQGIDIRNLTHKIPNTMSSLYSVLPKKFTFNGSSKSPQLDKLAIIIVSSRESDSQWGGSAKISNLMGEIICVNMKNGEIKFQLPTTFSDNCDNQEMFTNPSVIIDKVTELYKWGYKHIVYIAKAPYTSTLHMTQTEENDGLFFMSKDVIRGLKSEYHDLKIYPMFFDKYYAVRLEDIAASSLYIQDTVQLTNLLEDPSKKSVVFFNLFNGMKVGKEEERYYRGVISYATLLNSYKGILDDEDIHKGLIFDGSLKDDILEYLTLFHFSRYQKAEKQIHIKLDPYDNLIGDKSVGKLSLLNHFKGKGEFNSLAFLTLVRKVLNAK